jgi:hypothetical protein
MVFVGASRFPERRRRRVVLPAPFAGEKTLVRGLDWDGGIEGVFGEGEGGGWMYRRLTGFDFLREDRGEHVPGLQSHLGIYRRGL